MKLVATKIKIRTYANLKCRFGHKKKRRKEKMFLAKLGIKLNKTKWLIKILRRIKVKRSLRPYLKRVLACVTQLRNEKCLINKNVSSKP